MAEPLYLDFSDEAIATVKRELLMPLADASARIVRNEIVTEMDPGPARTGKTYKVPGTSKTHVASAPGQPPAIREGIYRDSWQSTPPVDQGGVVRAAVVNSVMVGEADQYPLGLLLEDGTYKMRPRPHIRIALVKARSKIQALLNRAIKR